MSPTDARNASIGRNWPNVRLDADTATLEHMIYNVAAPDGPGGTNDPHAQQETAK